MRIEELRKEAGLTRAELAKVMNVSRQSISLWEKGKRGPCAKRLPELARVLGCSISDLYGSGQKGA